MTREPWREVTAGQGRWRETYRVPIRLLTAVHVGGPADGTRLPVEVPPLPQARWYAGAAARRRRKVALARYVLHDAPDAATLRYRYTGTDERNGPVPGNAESPAWS